ncbi:MAG: hypothetical protein ABJD53_04200 [Gammaproteobacteria bacterium]
MPIDRYRLWSVLLLLGSAAGCAGNGQGLDENGQPSSGGGGGNGTITADFQSIQDTVFTPICSKCHIGASAPEGLQLDAGHSYNLLVGVASVEQPNLQRVAPGDPDSSYIAHKIAGVPGITGGQMPLGEAPLPQATIDAIRQWITNGAPNAPAAAAAAQSFAVQTTAPLDKSIVRVPPARILVTFTQDVDASLVNGSTVTLELIDGPQSVVTGDAQRMPSQSALAKNNPSVLVITPVAVLASGIYRVTLRGSGGGALANMNAATLGTDASFEFTVERGP